VLGICDFKLMRRETMLLGKFYTGLEIHRGEKIIFAKFLLPHWVLSTCRTAGGLQENMQYVYNHQSCEPTGHSHGLPAGVINDPESYREIISERNGLPSEYCATLGTAANMNNAVIISEKFRELEVVAVCTGGVETNAGRAGDPASVYENEDGFEKIEGTEEAVEHGTINTMLFISRELTPGAMVRVVMTATEAKTAVLQELAVNSRYSDRLATGTGTDQISVASMRNTGKPLTSAGKHSKFGELIGKSVYRAIKKTLALQNKLTPEGQCSVRVHIERFGAAREDMITGIKQWLSAEQGRLLVDNFTCIDRDPVIVAAVAALVHLKDKIAWGILPIECRSEIMAAHAAQVAAAVSGKYNRLTNYQETLVLIKDKFNNQNFLNLVYRAIALGFSEKWVWSFENKESA